ncbi:hypothetical protein [Agrobacterium tumefaciens]|uniref:hypothetical protein n=1 Tax=Agrobacterium tumefaciens TaxID=358 RepID=UPI00129B08E6|nr:hypothetical protein [Agrobacterium tumefaciens]MRH98636.1 hypothetical protein [Agrobacterium tumefaciens]
MAKSKGHEPKIPSPKIPPSPSKVLGLGPLGGHLLRSCRAQRSRFEGSEDWRRILALGVVTVDFALLGFFSSASGRLSGYMPGMASMFGGLIICIIMLRLSRPAIFLDWTFFGIFQVLLGMQVQIGLSSEIPLGTAIFYFSLVASALLLIVIGIQTNFLEGRAWLLAGGLCSLILSVASIAEAVTIGHLGPDNTLLISLLIAGLSVVGMGVSLKKRTS